jgi:hypothetical protein
MAGTSPAKGYLMINDSENFGSGDLVDRKFLRDAAQ